MVYSRNLGRTATTTYHYDDKLSTPMPRDAQLTSFVVRGMGQQVVGTLTFPKKDAQRDEESVTQDMRSIAQSR